MEADGVEFLKGRFQNPLSEVKCDEFNNDSWSRVLRLTWTYRKTIKISSKGFIIDSIHSKTVEKSFG